jgi:hypothetical protein
MEGGGEVSDSFKMTVTPFFNLESREFGCDTTDIAGMIHRKVACAKDEATKQALKALGWTPPEENAAMREAIRGAHERLAGLEDHLSGNHGLFLSDALSKLKPFLKP